MKPATVVVSLPVTDLDRSLRFYRDGLGLATADVDETIIAARSAPVAGGCIISCAIGSNTEVDDTLARAAAAGGAVPAAADEYDGSYTGYFSDPDGHLWELVCNVHTEAAATP